MYGIGLYPSVWVLLSCLVCMEGIRMVESEKDFILLKSTTVDGKLIELVNNLHCEVYELQIDGIPVFNCTDYIQAEYEYRIECA